MPVCVGVKTFVVLTKNLMIFCGFDSTSFDFRKANDQKEAVHKCNPSSEGIMKQKN